MSTTSKSRKGRGGPKDARRQDARDARLFKTVASSNNTFRRRMALATSSVSTSAGGVVTLTTLVNSSTSITGAADFSSCANMYVAYRVLAFEVRLLPFFPVNTTTVTVPVSIAVGPFMTGAGFTTFAGALDDSRSRCVSGYKEHTFYADNDGDLSAKLWNPTTGSIPSAQSFGLQCIGDSPTSTVSTPVWRVVSWALVEFKLAS